MKKSGTLSWNSRPLTSTTSPTVMAPATTSCAASHMIAPRPHEKIAFCPTLSMDRLVCVLSAARWYPRSESW